MVKRRGNTFPEFKGFIRCELTEKQKVELKQTVLLWEEASNSLIELTQQSWKVSFSYDHYNSCYRVSMSTSLPDSECAGWVLTAVGSEPLKALKQLFYKHYRLLKEQWGSGMTLTREELDD